MARINADLNEIGVRQFTRLNKQRNGFLEVNGLDDYLPGQLTKLETTVYICQWITLFLMAMIYALAAVGRSLIKKILIRFGWVELKTTDHEHKHDDKERWRKEGHCSACSILGNRYRNGKSTGYCTHNSWHHRFACWMNYKVKTPSLFYLHLRSSQHQFARKRDWVKEVRLVGRQLWRNMRRTWNKLPKARKRSLYETQFREINMVSGLGQIAPAVIPVRIGGVVANGENIPTDQRNQQSLMHNGVEKEGLVDTGATISVINDSVVRELGLEKDIEPWPLGQVRAANNAILNVRGVLPIVMQIGGAEVRFRMAVIASTTRNIILGMDILGATRSIIDCGALSVTLRGGKPIFFAQTVLEQLEIGHTINEVYPAKDITIPAFSQQVIPVKIKDGAGDT